MKRTGTPRSVRALEFDPSLAMAINELRVHPNSRTERWCSWPDYNPRFLKSQNIE